MVWYQSLLDLGGCRVAVMKDRRIFSDAPLCKGKYSVFNLMLDIADRNEDPSICPLPTILRSLTLKDQTVSADKPSIWQICNEVLTILSRVDPNLFVQQMDGQLT